VGERVAPAQAVCGGGGEIDRHHFGRARVRLRHHQWLERAAAGDEDADAVVRARPPRHVGLARELEAELVGEARALSAVRQGERVYRRIGEAFVLTADGIHRGGVSARGGRRPD
jgi:hypothetical protein